MWKFNLVVTLAADGRFQHLLEELSLYGDFRKTEFFGVILGQVPSPVEFLETVREKRTQQLIAFQDLGRVVPVDTCFNFRHQTFLDQVRAALAPYAKSLADKRFYVRLERRGLKGRLISPEIERALDDFMLDLVERSGATARIAYDDPNTVLTVETVGDRCGIGQLTSELMQRYDFVRVP